MHATVEAGRHSRCRALRITGQNPPSRPSQERARQRRPSFVDETWPSRGEPGWALQRKPRPRFRRRNLISPAHAPNGTPAGGFVDETPRAPYRRRPRAGRGFVDETSPRLLGSGWPEFRRRNLSHDGQPSAASSIGLPTAPRWHAPKVSSTKPTKIEIAARRKINIGRQDQHDKIRPARSTKSAGSPLPRRRNAGRPSSHER